MNMLSLLRRRLCCCFASTPGPRLRLMAFWIKCVFVYFFPPGLVQHDVEQRLRGRGSFTLTHRLTHSHILRAQRSENRQKQQEVSMCPAVTSLCSHAGRGGHSEAVTCMLEASWFHHLWKSLWSLTFAFSSNSCRCSISVLKALRRPVMLL